MTALVTGAGGFVGGHLVARLLADGEDVIAVDHKPLARWQQFHRDARSYMTDGLADFPPVDAVYHLGANMGNIEFIRRYRLDCAMSTRIDLDVVDYAVATRPDRLFYSSSACIYPPDRQAVPDTLPLTEAMAWPANPEPGYGLQKLYPEELLRYLREDHGVETRIARYHSIYGPHGAWNGGREKAPSALCRKVAEAVLTGARSIEIWGDGEQTRTYMHVDDAVEGTIRLTASHWAEPVNLGSDRLVSINDLARLILTVAGVDLDLIHVPGPQGVRGRSSDNTQLHAALGWVPSIRLEEGIVSTYRWVYDQVVKAAPP